MAFTVHYSKGEKSGYDAYDDAHSIDVKDWGLIEVRKDGEQVKLYSPGYWTFVEPGQKKRSAPVRIR